MHWRLSFSDLLVGWTEWLEPPYLTVGMTYCALECICVAFSSLPCDQNGEFMWVMYGLFATVASFEVWHKKVCWWKKNCSRKHMSTKLMLRPRPLDWSGTWVLWLCNTLKLDEKAQGLLHNNDWPQNTCISLNRPQMTHKTSYPFSEQATNDTTKH